MATTSRQDDLKNYIQNDVILNQKNKKLRDNYAAQLQANDKNQKEQLQTASIAQQKLLKYLPEYNAAMGLSGNGVSESTLLEADARYRSQQGKIKSDHAASEAQLLQNYNEQQMTLYDEARSEQENRYNLAMDTIANWTGSSEDLTRYKDTVMRKLSEEQRQSLLQQYNTAYETVVTDEKNQALYQDVAVYENAVSDLPTEIGNGKNFTLSIGDQTFALQFDKETTNEAVKKASEYNSVSDGSVFKYNGELYYKNGATIYKIESRAVDKQRKLDPNTGERLDAYSRALKAS